MKTRMSLRKLGINVTFDPTTNTTACIVNKDFNLSTLRRGFSNLRSQLYVVMKEETERFTMSKKLLLKVLNLDHTIVKAPYVRLIGEETGPKGDIISIMIFACASKRRPILPLAFTLSNTSWQTHPYSH